MTSEFDKKNAAKSRKVCVDMAEAASTGKRVLTGREYRILDMWPKFEDGEPVMVGDEATSNNNRHFTVKRIEFRHGKWMLNDSVTEGHYLNGKSGERAKRHVQSVLDADGAEIKVGETVWFKGNPRPYAVVEVKDGSVRLLSKTYCRERSATTVWTDILTHISPDSWERLEEDASKDTCMYFGTKYFNCGECPADRVNCFRHMKSDIVLRAKALAGVEEKA